MPGCAHDREARAWRRRERSMAPRRMRLALSWPTLLASTVGVVACNWTCSDRTDRHVYYYN